MTCYAAFAKDNTIRTTGSSGGIFPVISTKYIQDNHIVYAFVYDEDFHVTCKRISSLSDLTKSFCSKYVQGRMNDSLKSIQADLQDGRNVLFCGTPCQVAGVKLYLESLKCNTENVLLIDFICHGVPGEDVFQKYMERYSGTCTHLNMRDKTNGWNNGTFSWDIHFMNGSQQLLPISSVSYMKGFLADLYLRPSCYSCKMKGKSFADLTIGDFWGVRSVIRDIDFQNGVSCIIERTEKGRLCLSRVRNDLELFEVSYRDIAKSNSALDSSAKRPYFRRAFFKNYKHSADFDQLIESLISPHIVNRILNKAYSYIPASFSTKGLTTKSERLIYKKKELCCGCSACISACPTKAIHLKKDSEGFFYPVIKNSTCVHCRLCEKVCPIQQCL